MLRKFYEAGKIVRTALTLGAGVAAVKQITDNQGKSKKPEKPVVVLKNLQLISITNGDGTVHGWLYCPERDCFLVSGSKNMGRLDLETVSTKDMAVTVMQHGNGHDLAQFDKIKAFRKVRKQLVENALTTIKDGKLVFQLSE